MEGKAKRKSPVRFTPGIAEQICARIAAGEVWSTICREEGMPAHGTLYRWCDEKPEFREAFERACEIAADTCAGQALEVSRRATPATVQADRLHVSTLIWHASRSASRRNGPRADSRSRKSAVAAPVRIREFVPVTREDGSVFTREIRPDGSFVDAEG